MLVVSQTFDNENFLREVCRVTGMSLQVIFRVFLNSKKINYVDLAWFNAAFGTQRLGFRIVWARLSSMAKTRCLYWFMGLQP